MSANVAKSYLDIARSVVFSQLGTPLDANADDAVFGLLSCTYVYSYSALVSFSSAQLYLLWQSPESPLREKFNKCESFEQLMAGPLKELKIALRELAKHSGISPIHIREPTLWQNLNEFLKNYRDFFVHPNPEKFEAFVGAKGKANWRLPITTASGIMAYIYGERDGSVPRWVLHPGLKAHGFEIISV